MDATWVVRAVRGWRRVMGYDLPRSASWTAPSWTAASTRPTASSLPVPALRQARPVHQCPRVSLPPVPLPGGFRWGERPWCYCGKVWTDTGQGWAASERHIDARLPECAEAKRQRERDRARQRRQAIAADPVLAEQQRAYNREMQERRQERAAWHVSASAA